MNANAATQRDHEGALRLDDWTVLRVAGADAAAFLQSQLTQDMATLRPGMSRLAGHCSPKGRLLASFVAWRIDTEEFALLCSSDVAAAAAKRLAMYVLRARCRVELSTDRAVYGLAGPASMRWLGHTATAPWHTSARDTGWALGLPAVEGVARHVWVQPAIDDAPALPALAPQAWRWLEVMSGVPRITAATADQFVPQMVNFERVGGVDFHKGCYPGQEVVARSQYRGTVKRRMHLFATTGDAQPGQELFHSADPSQPAGMVVNAAADPAAGSRLLAEVKLAALESGSLHLGVPDGPRLQQLPLPYSIADTADM